jgi:hypothetical protein
MRSSTSIQPSRKSTTLDSYEKGRLFEEYIIQLFNQDSFKLFQWRRSQKLDNEIRRREWVKPDLEMIFTRNRKYHFAVECKWRGMFKGDKITWARQDQIDTYRNFENQYRIPVFIAIGIGGEPSSPERLFVTPLRNLELSPVVAEADLIPYKRKPTRRFFYDTVQGQLFLFSSNDSNLNAWT